MVGSDLERGRHVSEAEVEAGEIEEGPVEDGTLPALAAQGSAGHAVIEVPVEMFDCALDVELLHSVDVAQVRGSGGLSQILEHAIDSPVNLRMNSNGNEIRGENLTRYLIRNRIFAGKQCSKTDQLTSS